ncbi:DUF4276 family protein [Bradyrhizobium sp. STM 3809]|uniref:DUF4276 family protein n=1 Tax=Bradyrhizobium sp. STM 3809 TaxID=551936 RepID=UPI000240999F|nr:DUF4276 family protein [Bradyrhizobium sp. STM 3809]CCE02825.1 conserved hypothetical protein [Bradyrhizobium sp. STM 3809]
MGKKIGIIAEDKSDVAVIKVLIERIRNSPVSVKHFVGNGCGKLVGKCGAWSRELARLGCEYLVVVHDLDRRKLSELEGTLRRALAVNPIQASLIVIPVQEIEAWILSDEIALSKFFGLKRPIKQIANPETVANPKEQIGTLIYRHSGGGKRYVNTLHNERLAGQIRISRLRACSSFLPLENFVKRNLS